MKPVQITQYSHGIDQQEISKNAITSCEILQKNGYEAYIVGGAIRDLIIGLKPKDFDVVTNAEPKQIRNIFKRSRIIGKRFQLVHVFFGPEVIEISTFRANPKENLSVYSDKHGQILTDNIFGSREEDATRRDFTVNALYYDPRTEEIIDYHQGIIDLKNRQVRTIGNPNKRYREDPVRVLRAIRFSAMINGSIDQSGCLPMAILLKFIRNIPSSRLFCEILKLLTCGNSADCLQKLCDEKIKPDSSSILDIILKEYSCKSFIKLVLKHTDERIRAGKKISFSFLFAALFWPQVEFRWKKFYSKDRKNIVAINQAINSVLDELIGNGKLFISRRFFSNMREIWFMQMCFEQQISKHSFRMLDNPQFRSACTFLQLRAECGKFDKHSAQWWSNFSNADEIEKNTMIKRINLQTNFSSPTLSRNHQNSKQI